MTLTFYHFLGLSIVLFLIGCVGVLVRRNALIVLMSLELMLNAANLVLVAASRFLGRMDGQAVVFLVMAIAAAEVGVGLAIIVNVFRPRRTINVDLVANMKS